MIPECGGAFQQRLRRRYTKTQAATLKVHDMIQLLYSWLQLQGDRRAVTALEYGLIAAAIAAVIAGTVFTLGGTVNSTFSSINASM